MDGPPTELIPDHTPESDDHPPSTSDSGAAEAAPAVGDVIGVDAIMTPGGTEEEADGRTLRRTRNRDAVITALLNILREGELDPSVADIAERAGVSHRSVFRYFDDINDLVRTAIEREVELALPLGNFDGIGVGSLERRIDSWVDSRLNIYSSTFQVQRVARHRAPTIPAIDEGLRAVYDMARTRMETHFAKEFAALGSESGLVLDAALVLTSFESYDTHRRMFDHGTERIRQVWHTGLSALFGLAPTTD